MSVSASLRLSCDTSAVNFPLPQLSGLLPLRATCLELRIQDSNGHCVTPISPLKGTYEFLERS